MKAWLRSSKNARRSSPASSAVSVKVVQLFSPLLTKEGSGEVLAGRHRPPCSPPLVRGDESETTLVRRDESDTTFLKSGLAPLALSQPLADGASVISARVTQETPVRPKVRARIAGASLARMAATRYLSHALVHRCTVDLRRAFQRDDRNDIPGEHNCVTFQYGSCQGCAARSARDAHDQRRGIRSSVQRPRNRSYRSRIDVPADAFRPRESVERRQ